MTFGHVNPWHCILQQGEIIWCHFDISCGNAELFRATFEPVNYFALKGDISFYRVLGPKRELGTLEVLREVRGQTVDLELGRRLGLKVKGQRFIIRP